MCKKSKSELPKRVIAYLNNFDEAKEKALLLIDEISSFSFENDLKGFAEKSLASLLTAEFNGQVFPINLQTKEKKSSIRLTKNEEVGCDATIYEKKISTLQSNRIINCLLVMLYILRIHTF